MNSTIVSQQVHRKIRRSQENRFDNVTQPFHKAWNDGFQYRLNLLLPKECSQLLKSYISERRFRIKYEDSYSINYTNKSWSASG